MQILSLHLTGFCQFTSLKIDMRDKLASGEAAIIGLVGKNGSGKSNIFRAIRYALTDKADRPLVEFINKDLKDPKCSIELIFLHGGSEGRIYKEITAKGSNRKSFVWEGNTYKATKDIESKLEEILGSNKDILDKAVFIQQGEINGILNGTDAERETLFNTLFDVLFVEKNSKDIKTQIKNIKATIPQNVVDPDEIKSELDSLTARKETIIEGLAQSEEAQRLTADKQLCNSILSMLSRCREIDTVEIPKIRQEHHNSKVAQFNAANRLKALKTIEYNTDEVYKLHSEAVIELQTLQEWIELASTEYRLKVAYNEADKNCLPEDAFQHIQNLLEVSKEALAYEECLTALNSYKVQLEASTQELEQLTQADQKIKRQRDTLISETLPEVDSRRKQLAILLDLSINASRGSKCACGLPISDTAVRELRESREEYATQLEASKNKHAELMRTLQHLSEQSIYSDKQLSRVRQKVAQEQTHVTNFTQKLETLNKQAYATHNNPNLKQNINMLQLRVDETAKNRHERDQAKLELDTFLASTASRRKYTETIGDMKQRVEALDIKIAELASQIAQIENVRKLEDEVAAHERNTHAIEVNLSAAVKQIADMDVEISKLCTQLGIENDNLQIEQRLGYIEDQEHKRIANNALLRQLDEDIAAKTAVYEQKVQLHAQQAHKLKLIDNLELMATLFGRNGMTLEFVKHKFGKLGQYAKENLEMIEADFTIRADQSSNLSFLFAKLEAGKITNWMPMTAMSGGQKVRLCLAFLLALQRLYVVSVGLLFLDEPSNHLDDTGVDSLSNLFATMKSSLVSSNSQLWVCDHNKNLIDAFNVCVNLD